MEDLLLLFVILVGELEVRLGAESGIVRVLSYEFEVAFVLHAFFEDELVLYCRLLLAYPLRID